MLGTAPNSVGYDSGTNTVYYVSQISGAPHLVRWTPNGGLGVHTDLGAFSSFAGGVPDPGANGDVYNGFYYYSSGGNLYRINLTTLAGSLLTTGLTAFADVAVQPIGGGPNANIYASNANLLQLTVINLTTGAVITNTSTLTVTTAYAGLGFDTNGNFFGLTPTLGAANQTSVLNQLDPISGDVLSSQSVSGDSVGSRLTDMSSASATNNVNTAPPPTPVGTPISDWVVAAIAAGLAYLAIVRLKRTA